MRAKSFGKYGVLGLALSLFGCGGGGTISLPSGGYCTDDRDCNTAEGYSCVLTTSYDYKVCQQPVNPTECPSGHDGGEVDAGEIPDAGTFDGGEEVVDSGTPDSGAPDEDAGLPDAGNIPDSGESVLDAGDKSDSGEAAPDAGTKPDAGNPIDAGVVADAGTPVDAGSSADAGVAEVAFAFDREEWHLVGGDVYVFTWNTNYPATGELYLGSTRVEVENTLRYNHVLTHQFAPGTYPFKIVTSKETTTLFFTGSVTIASKPDLTAPVVVIAHGPVTETSTYIALSASEQLADQQLSCGPDSQHMTVRPSGIVGASTIQLNGLSPSTTYTCQLQVHDASPARNIGFSPYEVFTTLVPTVDQIPPFIVVYATQLSPDLPVTLYWSSSKTLATGVAIEYWTGTGQHLLVQNQLGGMTGNVVIPQTGQPALVPSASYAFTVTGTNISNGVSAVGQGTFIALPANPPTFRVLTTLSAATHPSTSIDLNWWSTKTVKAAQIKLGTSPTSLTMTPVNIATGLPADFGKVPLTGFNPVTTYYGQLVGGDLYDNLSVSDSLQRDLFTFTTWHTATGKVVVSFAPGSGATLTSVYFDTTDTARTGIEVFLTVQEVCSSSAVNRNPFEKMHVTTNAPVGGSITQPGEAVRIWWANGAPVLRNGSPILPLTTDSNYRGRAVFNPTDDECRALGLR